MQHNFSQSNVKWRQIKAIKHLLNARSDKTKWFTFWHDLRQKLVTRSFEKFTRHVLRSN